MRYLLPLLMTVAVLGTSCATIRRDRCFIAEQRYMAMRAIFEETGSYQRVAQAMNDEGWAHCEINQFRYRLRKDLGIEGEEYDELFVTYEPDHKTIDYNPGVVEGAIE